MIKSILNLFRSNVQTGKVKWFNPKKGFGFVETSDGDMFVHISAVEKAGLSTLDEGQEIKFNVEESKGRKSVIDIQL